MALATHNSFKCSLFKGERMKIYIGSDHNGYRLKEALIARLKQAGYDVEDKGDDNPDPKDDFPVFAGRVANEVLASKDRDVKGILICGSGQGMCMAANRLNGIRAALLYDHESARSSRNDDDANIACLPAISLGTRQAADITETFLRTPFAGAARYKRRIAELDKMQ